MSYIRGNAPPPYDDHQLPRYDDDLHNSVQKMKEQQSKIESLLKELFTTKNATLSKTTQDTIRNIMFIFESRFDSLQKDLLSTINQTAAWIQSIPVVEKEHTKMKGQIDQLLASTELLDAYIKKLGQSIKHKLHHIDRWTDSKNEMCKIPNISMNSFTYGPQVAQNEYLITDYLMKPLPVYAMERSWAIQQFLLSRRHEYLCSCYNCILNDMFKIRETNPNSDTHFKYQCPLDSDCTCITRIHRQSFKHSSEIGYIKGRDKELSLNQLLYIYNMTQIYKDHQVNRSYIKGGDLVCIPNLKKLSVDQNGIVNVPAGQPSIGVWVHYIINCTRRDGVDVFQYQNDRDIHETTADKLYVFTTRSIYPRIPEIFNSSDNSIICVPIEQYMVNTMFSDTLIMEESEDVKAGGSLYDKGKLLYRGQMKNGLPHGYGTGYYANGDVGHVGMFKGGKIVQ